MDFIFYDEFIQISKALFITGALWYNTGSPVITGEDRAEINAAEVERNTLVNVYGNEEIVWETNAYHIVVSDVDPIYVWENEVSAIKSTFYSGVDDNRWRNATYSSSSLETYWVNKNIDTPADGFILCSSDIDWYSNKHESNDELTLHGIGTASNQITHLESIYDCLNYEKIFTLSPMSNSLACCDQFYGNEHYDLDKEIWEGNTNWWLAIGMSTNMFYFPFESFKTKSNEYVRVFKLGGARVSTLTNHFTLKAGDPGEVHITSTSKTNGLYASVFQLEGDITDGDYFDTFVVSDGGESWFLEFEDNIISAASGEDLEIKVKVKDWLWGEDYALSVTLDYYPYGWQFLSPSFSNYTLIFSNSNFSSYQSFEGVAPTLFYTTGAAGLAIVRCLGKKDYIGLEYTGNPQGQEKSSGFIIDPVSKIIPKGETNSVTVTHVDGGHPYDIFISPVISSNELNNIRNVMTNLERTVVFAPPNLMQFECGTNWGYVESENINHNNNWNQYDTGDIVAHINDQMVEAKYTNSVQTFSGILSDVHCSGNANGQIHWHDSDGEGKFEVVGEGSHLSGSVNWNVYNFEDCYFEYPGTNVFNLKYIKKITVYAVAKCSPAERMYWSYSSSDGYTVSYDQTQPNFYENQLFGVLPFVCKLPDVTFPNNTEDMSHQFDYDFTSNFEEIKLIKLVEEEEPSKFPRFDLGTKVTSNLSLANYQKFSYTYEYTDEDDWNQSMYINLRHDNTVKIIKFVFIIDWAFKHLNSYEDFVPSTLNTPEWAGGN